MQRDNENNGRKQKERKKEKRAETRETDGNRQRNKDFPVNHNYSLRFI